MTAVPAQYQPLITKAAKATGLPEAVVAAQVNDESGFLADPTSSAGAEGMFQFLPSTYTGLGFQAGTEGDPSTEVNAYIKYMNHLLAWSGGDVQKALAGYNAGQYNWQAGLGYANTILGNAKSPDTLTDGTPGSTTPSSTPSSTPSTDSSFNWTEGTPFEGITWFGKLITGTSGSFSSIGDVAKAIAGLTQSASKFLELFAMLFRPEFWLRVGAFVVGAVTLGAALYFLKGSVAA